uniref:Phosphatidylinositol-glycan biosynthesis class X protein n=1 Tax=Salvator merianae TaxID=96440 RepID=A0A8D0EBA6_SALMN
MSLQEKKVFLDRNISSFWIVCFLCMSEWIYAQNTCPVIMQQLLNDGFHRNLLTRINFGTTDESIEHCTVALKVLLPKGLYVDPYELTSLQRHNITEGLVITDNVDLESPEYLSSDISVLVYMKPDPECFSCFRALLPLHCRYHRPAENGNISIGLESPEILIHCQETFLSLECLKETEIEAPCSLDSMRMCYWDSVKLQSENKELKLQIPVGLKYHFMPVCIITLLTTILCSGLILSALYMHGSFYFVKSSQ